MSMTLATIGQLRNGYLLAACCSRCARTVTVDLAALCRNRGDGYTIDRYRMAATCSRCGSRGPPDVTIRIGYRGYIP